MVSLSIHDWHYRLFADKEALLSFARTPEHAAIMKWVMSPGKAHAASFASMKSNRMLFQWSVRAEEGMS